MDTHDINDKASRLLRALEDGDAPKARDMLHGEDALEVAMHLALRLAHAPGQGARMVKATLAEVLAILAAERAGRDALARALGNPSGIVRDLAQLDHGRAVADLYAGDEEVEARR